MRNIRKLILIMFGALIFSSQLLASIQNDSRRLESLVNDLRNRINVTIPGDIEGLSSKDRDKLENILEDIDHELIRAGENFSDAAQEDNFKKSLKLIRKGLKNLKEARKLVRKGIRLAKKTRSLEWLKDIFDEILNEIDFAEEIINEYLDDNPWTKNTFQSRYTTPDGNWIENTLSFNGDSGKYETRNGEKGQFFSVKYRNNNRVVEGFWSFENNSNGWFRFELKNNKPEFEGQWGYGKSISQQRQGRWNGQY